MKQTGDDYFDSKEFREMLDNYEESVKSGHPLFMDADDLADIADYYHFMNNPQQADETIDYALSLYPNATQPNVFKAREALTEGDIDTAQQYVEQIDNKDDPDYQYMQAELLIAQDRIDEADEYLRQYFATIPPEEYQDFVMDVSNIYMDYGVNDKAYEWIMRSKGDNSNDFMELMARTLFGLGKYKDSERIFNELLDRNPYSKRYWNALASAQFMNEDFSGSVASSEYAIAIDPEDPEGLLSKANGLYRLGNFEEAIQYYERYEKVCEPESHILVQVYQELALCYSSLHQLDKAIDYLDKTKALGCDMTDLLVLKGHIYLENDHIREAEKAFKDAIIRSDNAPLVLLRIIVSLYDNKYLTACYSMFKKFFTMVDETFNEGHAYMALCCWDLGYTEDFMTYLRIAVDRNPYEAHIVLKHLFPKDMETKDYYHYMQNKLKK